MTYTVGATAHLTLTAAPYGPDPTVTAAATSPTGTVTALPVGPGDQLGI